MIQETIREELKNAMREKDTVKLNTLRGVLAGFTNELVALKRTPQDSLSEEEELAVIKRLVKQRRDSIEQYTKGGRTDLVEAESAELAILAPYLPAQMAREDIEKVVKAKITELGVTDKSKMGVLLGAVMKELRGQADGSEVKKVVEELLN